MLRWLTSYLSERTQKVKVNNTFSDLILVLSGVPQGSHLGPVLFNIFINDLTKNIKYCKFLLYADDMKMFGIVNDLNDSLLIQDDLNSINNWCKRNLMVLNVSKCNIISFSRKKLTINTEYCIEIEALKRVTKINDLGVIMDTKVDFNCHIETLTNNCRRTLASMMRRAKEFSDPYVTKALYCSLVRSKLEYASVVWNMIGITNSAKIESIQKQFLLFAIRNLDWRRDTYIYPTSL